MRIPGSDVLVGPVEAVSREADRLAALTWKNFGATRLAPTVGAELSGVDLRASLTDDVIAEIRAALHAYKVIFFRDQPITSAQHVAFAARFGELEQHPFLASNSNEPSLVRFAKSADAAGFENSWHHDVTWRECPSMGAILHAIEVPDVGGDTLFADMASAYEALDDDVKQRIDALDAEHDFMQSFGAGVETAKLAEMRAKYPVVLHPVVARHVVTGQRHLYVNRYFTNRIAGVSDDESRSLIDVLARQADYPEFQCRFRWANHSIAFWDNRLVQHYAASDYWPHVRVMERASIVGPRPHRG